MNPLWFSPKEDLQETSKAPQCRCKRWQRLKAYHCPCELCNSQMQSSPWKEQGMMGNPFQRAFGSDLSLTCPELTVVWRPNATGSMILMTAITSAITTTQQKPSLAQCGNPSAVQCHGTPERDSTYGLCQQRYSSKEDKNHSRTLLFIVGNGFRQVTASTQLGSFKDAAPVFPQSTS